MAQKSRPRGRRSLRAAFTTSSSGQPRRWRARPRRYGVPLVAVLGALALLPASASAQAELEIFFEETAAANWFVPHQCADGSTVQGRLLVQSTYDFESPETADADPTARIQFLAVCPDGRSYSWGRGAAPVSHASTENLKSVSVSAAPFTVNDILGVPHVVSFNVSWTGTGPIQTTVDSSQSTGFRVGTTTRKERTATATGTVTFDGAAIVSGQNNHFLTPFIRTDEDRYQRLP
jgi:hypothetical protein